MTERHWHNFRTGTSDNLPLAASLEFTEDQARQYIPQDEATQSLFACHIGVGSTPGDALLKTLEAVCGLAGEQA